MLAKKLEQPMMAMGCGEFRIIVVVVDCWLLVVGLQQLVCSSWLLVVGCWQLGD